MHPGSKKASSVWGFLTHIISLIMLGLHVQFSAWAVSDIRPSYLRQVWARWSSYQYSHTLQPAKAKWKVFIFGKAPDEPGGNDALPLLAPLNVFPHSVTNTRRANSEHTNRRTVRVSQLMERCAKKSCPWSVPKTAGAHASYLNGVCKINRNFEDIFSLRSSFEKLSLLCISTIVWENISPGYIHLT